MFSQKAFSLIELMVGLTVMAILTTVAVPTYRNYVIRSEITGLFALARPMQQDVEMYFNHNAALPPGNPGTGKFADVSNPGTGVALRRWFNANKAVELHLNATVHASLSGRQLWLIADVTNEQLTWKCGTHSSAASGVPCRYLPNTCQENCENSNL